ncbi:LysR family transcriptional regulator [Pseudonocardia alni]|uniref:LysR family transcriptional regulator n=1 Tax=Pseudonocardia alni TaxID=33907 RepID=UPI00280B13DD|nr:LysR family transcriptional regulator [Pseudonocardia alni]
MPASGPSADDLLVLLEVARSGRFTRAAETLGLNHVTVSRRVAALERALGGKVLVRATGGWELTPLGQRAVTAGEHLAGVLRELTADPHAGTEIEDVVRMSATDAFATFVAAPAAARVHGAHPGVCVEIVSATRRATQHRSDLDLEVVVGEPRVLRAEALRLGTYALGLYAAPRYLRRHRAPTTTAELADHRLVYFIASMLQVDDLDVGRRDLPEMRDSVSSTNVFAHVEATRAGGGIGLLPTFLAARHDDLVRLMPDVVELDMEYWLVARADTLRRPAVAAVVAELRSTMATMVAALRTGAVHGPPEASGPLG